MDIQSIYRMVLEPVIGKVGTDEAVDAGDKNFHCFKFSTLSSFKSLSITKHINPSKVNLR